MTENKGRKSQRRSCPKASVIRQSTKTIRALICSKLLPPDDATFDCLAAANKTQETSKIPLVKSKLFQGIKTPPYVVDSCGIAPTTYGGQKLKLGFPAVFRTENEGRIDKSFPVLCKRKF